MTSSDWWIRESSRLFGTQSAPISSASLRRRHRREFCHFADALSPLLLRRLLKGEGGAAEWLLEGGAAIGESSVILLTLSLHRY